MQREMHESQGGHSARDTVIQHADCGDALRANWQIHIEAQRPQGDPPPMTNRALRRCATLDRKGARRCNQSRCGLVLTLLVSFGCGTPPGQDVRYEPTPMSVVRALLELADVGPQDLVYDLGSGDGRIPITAAKEFGARGVGIEIDRALVTQAQANAREAGVEDKVTFRLGDMYAADVRSATVVTLFLHPGPNLKLREKLRSDLPAGSRIVSYVWDMGGWTPADIRRVGEHRIFLWRIPSRVGP